jgi:hypothetical protein
MPTPGPSSPKGILFPFNGMISQAAVCGVGSPSEPRPVRYAEKWAVSGTGRSFAAAFLPIILMQPCFITELQYRRDG